MEKGVSSERRVARTLEKGKSGIGTRGQVRACLVEEVVERHEGQVVLAGRSGLLKESLFGVGRA